MCRFTVLIPTHDHADTLFFSVASVLAQTKQDFEVFIVGDGAAERTREVVAALNKQDRRIRFFDNPKGPRHGEIHRHRTLQEAGGDFVCYLTDDDLWLPDHLEALEPLLQTHDLAHTLEVSVRPDGGLFGWLSDASWPGYAKALRGRQVPGIGLPCGGHTLEAYRRLPQGWRTTPAGIPTDHFMWLQFLEQPWCRAVSLSRPTVIHFDSPERKGWSSAERLAELALWSARLADPTRRQELRRNVLESLASLAHRDSLHHQEIANRLAQHLTPSFAVPTDALGPPPMSRERKFASVAGAAEPLISFMASRTPRNGACGPIIPRPCSSCLWRSLWSAMRRF